LRPFPHTLRRIREHPVQLSLAALAVALIASVVMALIAGPTAVWHAARHVRPLWLLAIAAGRVVAYGGYTLAYRATFELRRGPQLSPGEALALVAVGFGAFAAGGGFAVDRRALHGLGATPGGATSRVLGLGALEYAVLAPAAWVCALLLLGAAHVQPSLTLPWAVCVPLGVAAAAWLAQRYRDPRTDESGGRLRRAARHGLQGLGLLRALVLRAPREPLPWIGTCLYWAGELLSMWAGLRLFGLRVSPPRLILAYATGYAVSPRALPLAGVGITEVLMPLAYTWVGLALAPAIVAVFAYRLVTLIISLAPAIAARSRVEEVGRSRSPARAHAA
jgi:uncharacterized membrane protein YbhN (UPF0104 family)